MNFEEAISAGFRNYVNFKGRSSRSEYWYFVAFFLVVSGVVLVLGIMEPKLGLPLAVLIDVVFLLPLWSNQVRRLHDLDKTGWWSLIGLVPLLGFILLFLNCLVGTEGPNRFGPDPLGRGAADNDWSDTQNDEFKRLLDQKRKSW
jgi:uncharacterized membrane protein YhaH (DUF805 family)